MHDIAEDTIVATDGRTVLRGESFEQLRPAGTVPTDPAMHPRALLTRQSIQRLVTPVVGRYRHHTIHSVGANTLLATAGRCLWRSTDGGATWSLSDRLPASSPVFGTLASAGCEVDGTIYLGEYPMAEDEGGRVRRSHDGARTWTTIDIPAARHIHAVQHDPYTDDIWITTGDADEACHFFRLIDDELIHVGGGSQHWRAVELAFTPEAILWGVDCAYLSPTPIYRLDRDAVDRGTPTQVGTTEGSVFYSATTTIDDTAVVAFSTAIEHGHDSTAPTRTPAHADRARLLLASADTGFTRWTELAAFRQRPAMVDAASSLSAHRAGTYLHVDTLDGAFVINPLNTARLDGHLLSVPARQGLSR